MHDRVLREAERQILNAPFEERGWERAVEAVAEATRSHAAQLLGLGGPLFLPLNVFVGPPAAHRKYIEDAALHGPCNWRVGSTTTPMAIQQESDYAAYRRTHATADYDDAASDMDIQYGCQSALMLDPGNMIGLAVLRGRRDGPTTSEVRNAFAFLRHQMARAVRMQIALDGEAAELMLGDFEAMKGATLLLDRHGGIAAVTPAAEALFGEGGPLRLVGVAVELRNPAETAQLVRLMARLLRDGAGGQVGEMRVGQSAAQPRGQWRMFLTRLPGGREHGLGFEPHLALSLKPAG